MQKTFDLVSVIIPTYNRSCSLLRCVESVKNQTYKNIEILVCDDCSTDNTEIILQNLNLKNLRYFKTKKRFGGPAAPRNLGLSHAKGKYVAFLDSDDWYKKTKIELCVNLLNSGYHFIYHDLIMVKKKCFSYKNVGVLKSKPLKKPIFENLFLSGGVINNSSVCVETKILNQTGGFTEDPKMISCEDYELWLRISKKTEMFFYIPKCLGYYTISEDSICSSDKSIVSTKVLKSFYKKSFPHKKIPFWMLKWNLKHIAIQKKVSLLVRISLLHIIRKVIS